MALEELANETCKRQAEEKKMSSKKRKALDKYISRKLRKEEGASLLKSLAESCVQNTLLQSTKNVGSGPLSTKQKLKRALDFEKAGLAVDADVFLYQDLENGVVEQFEEEVGHVFVSDAVKNIPQIVHQPKAFTMEIPSSAVTQVIPKKVLEVSKISASDVDVCKPTFYVTVNRTESIRASRLELPIVAEEQQIMEAIKENSVLILSGETGSGKTTQVPQFLYEAGYGHANGSNPGIIGITQPRRVAAVSMARRVSLELNVPEKEVSYQIRYDGTVNPETKIKFMTDGVLLKEISADFLLSKYSCIIIDEAHERSLNTDILIGLLSRIIVLRNNLREKAELKVQQKLLPLKLIIMSATLRVEDFTKNSKLFSSPPPHVSVEARQHPVTIHFDRKTSDNYVVSAFKKVCKIHQRLPSGGILVFMTGQNEIIDVVRRLKDLFKNTVVPTSIEGKKSNGLVQKSSLYKAGPMSEIELCDVYPEIDQEAWDDYDKMESDDDDEEFLKGIDQSDVLEKGPLHVLPLFASMASEDQLKVFNMPPPGHRLCIIATNVAETSITIPGIKYVVDCGRVKQRTFDQNGVSSFDINWISKASANQRAGRAGRTGPGHCYRLYSSALFHNQFEDFSKPEIERTPIEGIVLQMKDMNIDQVVNFPFVSAPASTKLAKAEKILRTLGALDKNAKITELGRLMAQIPVAPRFARMLFAGKDMNVLSHAITMVSCLSVGDPFIRIIPDDDVNDSFEESIEDKKSPASRFKFVQRKMSEGLRSDILKNVRAVGAWQFEKQKDKFIVENFLQAKAMKEIHLLREQLSSIMKEIYPNLQNIDLLQMKPLNTDVIVALKQALLVGFIDQVAKKKEVVKVKYESATPYSPLFSIANSDAHEQEIYVHPGSSLAKELPSIVIYHELNVAQNGKIRMKGMTEILPSWISKVGHEMCTFSKPLDTPAPRYDPNLDCILCSVVPRFGEDNLDLPIAEIKYPEGTECARVFLKLLLEGKILTTLKRFENEWTTKPSIFTNKKIPITYPKIYPLISIITSKKIFNKKDLLAALQTSPKLLLDQLLDWLPKDKCNDLREVWLHKK